VKRTTKSVFEKMKEEQKGFLRVDVRIRTPKKRPSPKVNVLVKKLRQAPNSVKVAVGKMLVEVLVKRNVLTPKDAKTLLRSAK
jgi:hypothetical protein